MNTKQILKRLLSVMLTLIMIVSIVPTSILSASAKTSADYSISDNGVKFICEREGFSATCFPDNTQSSIGYGTKCTGSAAQPHARGLHRITKEEALRTMKAQINSNYAPKVRRQTQGIEMNQNQFDALVSLCYQTGGGNSIISDSPLVKYLKGQLSKEQAKAQYSTYYTRVGNIAIHSGVVNRRNAEADLFFAGISFTKIKGYVFPVACTSHTISTHFSSSHGAIDIAGVAQKPVLATISGKVIRVDNNCGHTNFSKSGCPEPYKDHNNTCGNCVYIQHDDTGYVSVYGHLYPNSIKVKVGDKVEAGQQIALVGSSGKSTGYHLHFEIRPYANEYWNWYRDTENINVETLSYTYLSEPINGYIIPPAPATPTIHVNKTDIATGDEVTLSWNTVDYADCYALKISSPEGEKTIDTGNRNAYPYTLTSAGKYSFQIMANGAGGPSDWSSAVSVTAHDPVTVIFKHDDGSELSRQTIKWGTSAVPPGAPFKKGYTFQNWDGSYIGVTSDRVITAVYKINTYRVNFLDKNGNVIKAQNVLYDHDATPPTDTKTPAGYEFVGWNSEDYKNVYTEASNMMVNIRAIYKWGNDDLPIIANITSAERENDGYYVTMDLTNYNIKSTTGRAIAMVKTEEGKLVESSESTAFTIGKGKTKTGLEVFIPSDEIGTIAEVIVVNSYSDGIPLSNNATAAIVGAKDWSKWSETMPSQSAGMEIQQKFQYRYRDAVYTSSTTTDSLGDPWNFISRTVKNSASGSSTSAITASDNITYKREITSTSTVSIPYNKTQWYYTRYIGTLNNGTTRYGPTAQSLSGCGRGYTGPHGNGWLDNSLACIGTSNAGVPMYSGYWYNQTSRSVIAGYTPVTTYHYTDTFYQYNFWRWGDWSEWIDSETEVADSTTSDRDTEGRTVYRSKSTNIGTEDTAEPIVENGKLDPVFAGKQITMFVFGYTGASDYTDEYIGQSVVAPDGSYSFEIRLKSEPTQKTGDYTVAIGIEGTTDLIVVDTIEAPKPVYNVKFYNIDGTVYNEQEVIEGENAVVPQLGNIPGKIFRGWTEVLDVDGEAGLMNTPSATTNIIRDMEYLPIYEDELFTIVFVDYMNETVEIKKLPYGALISGNAPEMPEIEGYDFVGWDQVEDAENIVSKDMVVSALYEKKVFDINFVNLDGEVIDHQEVYYGDDAIEPDSSGLEVDNMIFTGWYNVEDYLNIDCDAYIVPSYIFEETTVTPTANYATGEYNETIQLTLSVDDENAIIFYYLNDESETPLEYAGPITLDRTCSVTFFASSFEKNDSESVTNYYCINTADTPSDWMLFDQLPEEVKNAPQDYSVEQRTGYSFKNVQVTSDKAEIAVLEEAGWILENTETTDPTEWQTTPIEQSQTLQGFEVEERYIEDDINYNAYQYSRYKNIDVNGNVTYYYEPKENCEYEIEYKYTSLSENPDSYTFMDDELAYYFNGETWFNRLNYRREYRSSYQILTYYSWTPYSMNPLSPDETREYETKRMYRYRNHNYHLVEVVSPISADLSIKTFVKDGESLNLTDLQLTGYTLTGLKCGADFDQTFALDSAVSQSLTLMAVYTPINFTVQFKYKNTVFSTQQVPYLGMATEPMMPEIDGYVFVGWDKDFNCITEDTIVYGRYLLEYEYARVSLNKTKANLYQGTVLNLYATISPSNLVGEELEWQSADSNVAVVDNNGVVTAVGSGTTTITVKVKSSNETASCVITVDEDISSNIILSTTSRLNYDEWGFLRRVSAGTTVGEIRDQFKNTDLRFVQKDLIHNSETILDDSGIIGTGTEVQIIDGETVVDSKTFVVIGDATGDGRISVPDISLLMNALVDKYSLSEAQKMAMNVSGDSVTNNRDAALIAQYLVGKASIDE